MKPCTPISTLFPYTTLFRSFVVDAANSRVLEYYGPFGAGKTNDVTPDLVFGQGPQGNTFNSGDRKSTRLNSSHRCISYAVFCLEKKKVRIDSFGVRMSEWMT